LSYVFPPVKEIDVTIANGQTTSDAFDTEHYKVGALHFGTMTGTTMTFEAAEKVDGTYRQLVDDSGAAISITVTDDRATGLTSNAASMAIAGVRWLKLVSGSSEGAERTIGVTLVQ
jgi:hypothetical protein